MTDENKNGWVKLFTPEGALVTIPIDPLLTISKQEGASLLTSVSNLIAAGFSVREPGLEEGEASLEAAFVARRTAGDKTPIIDFFAPHVRAEKKVIHVYLNTPEDVAAFEKATGLKVSAIPEWDGDLAITKAHAKAQKYIVKLPHPVRIVYEISQKWAEWNALPQETRPKKEPMKKVLIRYEGNGHNPAQNGTGGAQGAGNSETLATTPPMTFATACKVLTPGGKEIGQLSREHLETLRDSHASNVTDEMRQAASIVLENLAPR
jgi:hypothetical protein